MSQQSLDEYRLARAGALQQPQLANQELFFSEQRSHKRGPPSPTVSGLTTPQEPAGAAIPTAAPAAQDATLVQPVFSGGPTRIAGSGSRFRSQRERPSSCRAVLQHPGPHRRRSDEASSRISQKDHPTGVPGDGSSARERRAQGQRFCFSVPAGTSVHGHGESLQPEACFGYDACHNWLAERVNPTTTPLHDWLDVGPNRRNRPVPSEQRTARRTV